MSYFVDSEEKPITEINPQNVHDFMLFVGKSSYDTHEAWPGMKFNGVELNDLIGDYPYGLSERAQIYLGKVLGSADLQDSDSAKKMASDLLDCAQKNPILLRTAFMHSGNMRGNSDTSLFNAILEQMKNRSLSQNLPALVALAPTGSTYAPLGKMIKNPTHDDIKMFEELYRLSQKSATQEEKNTAYHCQQIFKMIAKRGEFANSELSKEVRRAHNDAYFDLHPTFTLLDEKRLLGQIETDNYRKQIQAEDGIKIVLRGSLEDTPQQAMEAEKSGLLFVRLNNGQVENKNGDNLGIITDDGKILQDKQWLTFEEKVLTTDAKFFEIDDLMRISYSRKYGQKNADGTISDFDLKSTEICWHLIEQTDKRDQSSGQDKTYLQRFKDMVGWNDQKYLNDPGISPLMRDMYIHAAQRDVIEGRAANLDEKALGAVLANDKTGYYFSKISQDVLDQYPNKFPLNRKQQAILHTRKSVYALQKADFNYLQDINDLTSTEKRKVLEGYEASLENSKIAYESDLQKVKKIQADRAKIEDYRLQISEAEVAQSVITQLKEAYTGVKEKLKTADASDQAEKHLREESLNILLTDALNGKEVRVEMPDYGNLPWFGQKKQDEIARRDDLQVRIEKLNRAVHNAVLSANNPLLKQYAAQYGLLSTQAESNIHEELKKRQNTANNAVSSFKYEYSVREIENITNSESYVDKINSLRENIHETKEKLRSRETSIRGKAKTELVSRGLIFPKTEKVR